MSDSRETEAAFDALKQLLAHARQNGMDEAEIATASIHAALGLWRHVHGEGARPYAASILEAVDEAEAARVANLDPRLLGKAYGNA